MGVSQNRGPPIETPKTVYYWDPQDGTPCFWETTVYPEGPRFRIMDFRVCRVMFRGFNRRPEIDTV